jgi:opacity protein-like surface antigen
MPRHFANRCIRFSTVIALVVAVVLALPWAAGAQTRSLSQAGAPGAGGSEPSRGYVEGFAASAFGNVTSQAYGGEVGVTLAPGWQVFAEGGQIRNVATDDISNSAQIIAAALSQMQSNVGFSVKQPATFFDAGIKYLFPTSGRAQPYVTLGGGVARVKQNVTFTIAGVDVTSNLQQYGVQLGSDLSGSFTKAMITLGAGVAVPLWGPLALDLQYRYGRIFAEDQGINTNRVGAGAMISF